MSILKSILISTFLLTLIACGKQNSNLSNEKLAAVIADMHITEVALQRQLPEQRDSLQQVFLGKLEKIHDLPREEIKREVELLMEDRSRQGEVYEIVIDKLKAAEADIKNKQNSNKN